MSSSLGSSGAPGARPTPPSATRASHPGWRDPRLWVGVAIVAASVLVGARVLAGADDTTAVWAVASDTGTGETLAPDDLVTQRVRFADAETLDRYFTVDDVLPDELVLLRGLGEGEILPRSAIGTEATADTVEISLPVAPLLVPPAVAPGSVVDVYLSDRAASADRRAAPGTPSAPALDEVRVVAAPAAEETFAASGDRQVVLAVPTAEVDVFYGAMDAMGDPVVSIVRRS